MLKTDFALDDSCVLSIRYCENAPFVSTPYVIINVIIVNIVHSFVSLIVVESSAIDPPFSFDILLGFFFLSF